MSTKIIDPNATMSEDRTGDPSALMAAIQGGDVAMDTGSVVSDEDLEQDVIGGSALDSLFGEGSGNDSTEGDESDDSREAEDGSSGDDTNVGSDIEEIVVKGADGKRRKISVDLSNRQQMIQNARMAAGARKWQAERDRALADVEKLRGSEEKIQNFDRLSEAYELGGPLQVLKEMLGEDEAVNFIQQQVSREQYRSNASEDELRLLEAQETSERQARELERLRRTQEEWEKKVAGEREAAEVAELQSLVNPVFEKYRFAGKLEDADMAQELDEMVWERGRALLRRAEEQGHQITRELTERAFRTAANRIRKFTNQEASRKADRSVKQTKEKALSAAQKKTQRGLKSGEANDKAADMIRKGDISGFFKSFGSGIKFE